MRWYEFKDNSLVRDYYELHKIHWTKMTMNEDDISINIEGEGRKFVWFKRSGEPNIVLDSDGFYEF